MGYRMKVEVGQNYKVKNCDYAFEVVAIDNRNTVWGLASGVMLSRYHSEIISEWKDSPCSKCKDEPDPGEGWRLPTDADKGKPCRVKDKESEQWYESRFLVTDGRRFLARRDEDSYAYPYDFCEVQDET